MLNRTFSHALPSASSHLPSSGPLGRGHLASPTGDMLITLASWVRFSLLNASSQSYFDIIPILLVRGPETLT